MELKWADSDSLRRLAEESVVRTLSPSKPGARSDRLFFDLLVHKAELEMQNEALREAELELGSAHSRYKALFDHAPIAYVVVDARYQIVLSNLRAAALFGKTSDDLAGTRLTSYLTPEEALSFERYRREAQKAPNGLTAEFTMVLAGGERREIRVDSVSAKAERGDWCIALTDVTIHNDVLRKLDHLERLQAVQQRASSIAHSLNNLLFGILGHAEVALHFVEPGAPAHAPLMHLREVVQRCASATEQLTSFSRAESEQPAIVDLNAALSEMSSLLPALLGEDVEVELKLDAPDSAVRLDREHIEQIVLNAARNSRQAMPHGGSFRIETATVELPRSPKIHGIVGTRFVKWKLSDTGIGMTESARSRAFEPFFTTKPPGVGTGLGLSMVKAAVERSGGFVSLESELARGTALVIYLPRATGTASTPPAPGERAETEEPFARVALVNDDVEVASAMVNRLMAEGCEVSCVGSGSGALDLLREGDGSLTVLLVDQRYPDFVIDELVRVARETSPWVEIVVTPLELPQEGAGAEAPQALEEAVKLVVAAAVRARAQ